MRSSLRSEDKSRTGTAPGCSGLRAWRIRLSNPSRQLCSFSRHFMFTYPPVYQRRKGRIRLCEGQGPKPAVRQRPSLTPTITGY